MWLAWEFLFCWGTSAFPLGWSFSIGGTTTRMLYQSQNLPAMIITADKMKHPCKQPQSQPQTNSQKQKQQQKQQHSRWLSSALAASSSSSSSTNTNNENESNKAEAECTKVIVVGAGMAGLSTAYNLWKLAAKHETKIHVEILEVRDRIGGRVQPVAMDDDGFRVDLGGQWLHESSPLNPIRRLMEDDLNLGFVDDKNKKKKKKNNNNSNNNNNNNNNKKNNRFQKKGLKNVLFEHDGKLLERSSVQRARNIFYKAMDEDEEGDAWKYSEKSWNSISFRDLLEERTKIEKLSDQKRKRRISSGPSFDMAMNYFVHRAEGYEGGKLEEVSAFLDLYREYGGPDRVVKGSYQSILQALSTKMGLNNSTNTSTSSTTTSTSNKDNDNDYCNVQLRQNAQVKQINYGDSNSITISVEENKSDAETFESTRLECDYCVCTVPLGVLQEGKIDFVPPLPDSRQEAIDSIGMGILNKIVFRFDFDNETNSTTTTTNHKFWGELEQFAICHEDPALIKTYYDCSNDYCDSDSRTAILVQFLAGSAADRLDPPRSNGSTGLTDEEAIEESLEALRAVFGSENVPHPTTTKVTRWRNDPWSCGSYSFAKVGSSRDMYDEIASPLGRLGFGGEHTSKHYHSTVHGAWDTGTREASRILDQLL